MSNSPISSATMTEYAADDRKQWIEERAAIMEFDGGLTREEADYRAAAEWFRRMSGSKILKQD